MKRFILVLSLLLPLGVQTHAQEVKIPLDSVQSSLEYRIQILSKSYADSDYFKDLKSRYECEYEVWQTREGNTYYRYLLIPPKQTSKEVENTLEVARFYYPKAFIVKYFNEKRYN